MAKKFVRISLAVKFRLFFGLALILAISAALGVMWLFVEGLSEQSLEGPTREISRLRLNEFRRLHPEDPTKASDADSAVIALYRMNDSGVLLTGPSFIPLVGQFNMDDFTYTQRSVIKEFQKKPSKEIIIQQSEDDQGNTIFRCFRAVRNTSSCNECHAKNPTLANKPIFRPNQLVGMIELTMPESAASEFLGWLTRGAFVAGGALAGLLAMVMFAIISHKIVFRPVHSLRELADKVAEGDLSVRSEVKTGDELERLGESFNEMLSAIQDQHNKLRSANRALDQKLFELSEANSALFQANVVKSEFLANVSHELRTPLNSIIGFAELLGDSADEKVSRYGRNIAVAAKNLLAMINDMLELARIEAGKARIRADKVSVLDTCQTLLNLMKPLSDKSSLELVADLDEKMPFAITDGSKLQQILYNLLSNAIKFTPAGGKVILRAYFSETEQTFTISVIDTGPGISKDDQEHVFEKFYQAEPTLTKEVQGTGLGLAISKELAELLKAKITLKSTPGKGTTFSLILPAELKNEEEPK